MLATLVSLLSTPSFAKPAAWADGEWSGWGTQKDNGGVWSLELSVKGKKVEVRYPSLDCGGKWEPTEAGEGRASFVEKITDGPDRCTDGGTVVLMPARADVLSFVWFMPDGEPMATAFLTRR